MDLNYFNPEQKKRFEELVSGLEEFVQNEYPVSVDWAHVEQIKDR